MHRHREAAGSRPPLDDLLDGTASPVLGSFVALLPAAAYVCDRDGVLLCWNARAEALWGRVPRAGDPAERYCGSLRLYRLDGGPLPHDACPVADALRTGAPARDREVVIERPDGSRITALVNIDIIRDGRGGIAGAINCFLDITARKRAEAEAREREERLRMLAREVDHRARNMLSTVGAIARATRADSVPEYIDAFLGRIDALWRVHAVLAGSRWRGADLGRLLGEELAAYDGDGDRIALDGPLVSLGPQAAQALSLTAHELATNAAKYGALSVPAGRLSVHWTRDDDGSLRVRWREAGGPPVRAPARRGFGTDLIASTVEGQLAGAARFVWRTEGLVCELRIPADALAAD